MSTIWIKSGVGEKQVSKTAYAEAKLRQLHEFGYSGLTLDVINEAIEKALSGKADDIISLLIEDDMAIN